MPKIEHYIRVAEAVRGMSKDPSTKVAAIAVDDDGNILSTGYNGFPRGVHDDEARYNDRATKLALVSHAEANLVAQAARNGVALKGSTVILVSLPPCSSCTKLLIQAGVKRVVIPTPTEAVSQRWRDEWVWGELMLREAGVQISFYKE